MKVFIVSCLLAVTLSSNVQGTLYEAPSYPDIPTPASYPTYSSYTTPPSYSAYPSYPTPPPYPVYPSYPTEAPETTKPSEPYSFGYNVQDVPSYNYQGRQESGNGDSVSGSYYVVLPDGRREMVNYKDNGDGLTADVKYDEPSNKPSQPAGYQKY